MNRFPPICAIFYLAFTLPLLWALALVTPPWQNPDEPLHMARAVQVAHGGLFGSRAWGTAGGYSDRAIYAAYKPVQKAAMHPQVRLTSRDLQASMAVPWSPRLDFTSFPNTAQYPPLFYLPAAAAYWLGRSADLTIDQTLLLARVANATAFAAITAFAVAIAGPARLLLVAILLLPTTLSLACAAGQDSLLFAAVALAVAITDRVRADARTATRLEAIAVAALLVGVAAARPPYAGFLLVLLLLQPAPDRKLYALLAASVLLTLLWCLAVASQVSVPLGGADVRRQIAFLHENPGAILPILENTWHRSAAGYWQQFIGVLGWTDAPLPRPYIYLQTLIIGLAAAATIKAARPRFVPIVGILFAVVTIFLLQWLTWTWPGQDEITGVLGRYFIPTALLAALLSRPGRRELAPAAWGAIAIGAALTPAAMVHTVVQRYYGG